MVMQHPVRRIEGHACAFWVGVAFDLRSGGSSVIQSPRACLEPGAIAASVQVHCRACLEPGIMVT